MGAALDSELVKLRRAGAVRLATAIIVGVVPAISTGFFHVAVSGSGQGSVLEAKVAPLLQGTGWDGLMGFCAEMMSIAALLAVGIIASWSFGREFVDKTFPAFFAIPTSRRRIAWAKIAVLVGWGIAATSLAAVAMLVCGVAIGLGMPDTAAWHGMAKIAAIGSLTTVATTPLGFVSSARRSYLAGISTLLGIVVTTEILVSVGSGAWIPYAAPGLWSGMGGAAVNVSAVQLLLPLPLGLLGAWATAQWWATAESG